MTPAEPLIVAAILTLTAWLARRRRPRDLGHLPSATVDRLQRHQEKGT